MAHVHIYGEELTHFFVAQHNSDQTEGRGGIVDAGAFEDVQDAYKRIEGQGVMGVGDGDIVLRMYYRCDACPELVKVDEPIYQGASYTQRNLLGRPGRYQDFMQDGWRKDYSPVAADPEFEEYLRLKRKFES